MEYEWDERKRLANIAKHGLDFLDAPLVFAGPQLVTAARHAGETRHVAIGRLDHVFVTVIYTWRGNTLRIISMRRARHAERVAYQDCIG